MNSKMMEARRSLCFFPRTMMTAIEQFHCHFFRIRNDRCINENRKHHIATVSPSTRANGGRE